MFDDFTFVKFIRLRRGDCDVSNLSRSTELLTRVCAMLDLSTSSISSTCMSSCSFKYSRLTVMKSLRRSEELKGPAL